MFNRIVCILIVASLTVSVLHADEEERNVTISRLLDPPPPSVNTTSENEPAEEEYDYYDDTSDVNDSEKSNDELLEELIDRGQVNDVGEALRRLQSSLKLGVGRIFKELFPLIARAGLELNVTSSCMRAYMLIYQELREGKNWAFQMIDANGKPPSGILTGTLTDLGSFDQCLRVSHTPTEGTEATTGKYCLLDLRAAISANLDSKDPPEGIELDSVVWNQVLQEFWMRNDLLSFRYGLCVPSQCSAAEVGQFAHYFATTSGLVASVDHCQTKENLNFNPDITQIFVLSGISLLVFTTLIGTLMECFDCTSKAAYLQWLLAFSLYSNTIRLFGAKPAHRSNEDKPNLECLNGLRFFSVCWVIIGHTYYYTDFILYHHYRNLSEMLLIDDSIWFTPIANFTLSVDTFFYISGLLLMYTTWGKLSIRNGHVDWIDFVLHRVWRIWPSYATVIGIAIVLPLLSSGPLWPESVEHQANNCRESWWMNLLFINNFQLSDKLCLLHTWYLSASMQFHVASAIFLFAIYKSRTIGFIFTGVAILALSAVTYYHAWIWNVAAPTIIPEQVFADYSKTIMGLYMKPYTHGGAYLAGIVGGWTLINYKKFPISCKANNFLWGVGALIAILVIVAPYQSFNSNLPTVTLSALYWAFNRLFWAIFIGWLIHACATGHGGVINHFLSWSAFRPLGTLSYLAYLIHPLLMMLHTGLARERVNLGHYELIQAFLARLLMSFGTAYAIHVAVEIPFAQLEKYVFPSRRILLTPPAAITGNGSGPSSIRSTSTESIERESGSESGTDTERGGESNVVAATSIMPHMGDKSFNGFPLSSIFRGRLSGSYALPR